jgi:nicotinamide phosphoribosyltransferase
MFSVLPPLQVDGYKVGHPFQYPPRTTRVYSNWTPRASRVPSVDRAVLFGPQFYVKHCLVDEWNRLFFDRPKDEVIRKYRRRITAYVGSTPDDHIADLHDLRYLPLVIKALPEGTRVPMRVPMMTWQNTIDHFYWVTNAIETQMSNVVWHPVTTATTAFDYRLEFERAARWTGLDPSFVHWQGHDFSYRGMVGMQGAALSGAAHLAVFRGTDTVPALDLLEYAYGGDCEAELLGMTVPATEHSVMSMGRADGERETIRRLIMDVYPVGPVSIVSDTWDFWKVITEILPSLREEIMSRGPDQFGRPGCVVARPDSGDPVKMVAGDRHADRACVRKGAWECLWDTFGGEVNARGFRALDSHVGLIYGDAITRRRQEEILEGLITKGFVPRVVLGLGSFTFQYVTRDTYGQAVKATYGEVDGVGQAIYKAPATDDGTKHSARGLLYVDRGPDGVICLREDVSAAEEGLGLLQPIFRDSEQRNVQTIAEIRARVEAEVEAALAAEGVL